MKDIIHRPGKNIADGKQPESGDREEQSTTTYAAVDLGSNSFHLVIARYVNGNLSIIDDIKEMVRLAGGLDENNRLSQDARERAIDCLQRFGQRLKSIDTDKVRVVGTNTLRRAKGSAEFLKQIEEALGYTVEIISGREEARLIYVGVSKHDRQTDARRLIIDIGGGSTEFALGDSGEPQLTESLYMGCVGVSKRCFMDGCITGKAFTCAELIAHRELETMAAIYRKSGWQTVIGTSGTILSAASVCEAEGWSKKGLTLDALYELRKALIADAHTSKLFCKDMVKQRAPVFPGGVAILIAAFEALAIDRMYASKSALRAGLLYELYGRLHQRDTREITIDNLCQRFNVDLVQAGLVRETAQMLRKQVADDWLLRKQKYINLLSWAAELHEIGLSIAHSRHHKHAAYLIANADLAGFSRQEQEALATVILCHRNKIDAAAISALTDWKAKHVQRTVLLLRLSVVLHRSRTTDPLPEIQLSVNNTELGLKFPRGWLEKHPLTHADLEQEAQYQERVSCRLKFE